MKFGVGDLYFFQTRPTFNRKKCAVSHECTNGLLHLAVSLLQIMSDFYLRVFHRLSLSHYLGKLNKLQKTPLSMNIILYTDSRFTQFPTSLLGNDINCQFFCVHNRIQWLLFTISAKGGPNSERFFEHVLKILFCERYFHLKRFWCQEICRLDLLIDNVARLK